MVLARRVACFSFIALIGAHPLSAEDVAPLSAIDWLSNSVSASDPIIFEPEMPAVNSATSPSITVTALDDPSPDRVGILSSDITGLPSNLWSGTATNDLISALATLPAFDIPALRDFVTVLMLAEAQPPLDAGPEARLFLARTDTLLAMGRLEEALALLEAAKPETPALFRRYFDISLLTGEEDRACNIMRERPAVAPTVPARIFCLARSGDWNAAALTLNTNRVLGDVGEVEIELLTLFLDPELAEGTNEKPLPDRISPLIFRLCEAIGERLATSSLALAFAHADLRPTTGWKTQLDAAERLARNGALSASKLQELYGSRTPSASGGVWDRIDAFQRFEIALGRRDPSAVSRTLPPAWEAMKDIRSEVAFAELYSSDLIEITMSEEASQISNELGLLTEDYELISRREGVDPFLRSLAQGRPQETLTTDPMRLAIQAAFNGADVPVQMRGLAESGQLGRSLLMALRAFDQGVRGDQQSLTDAIALFRYVGLEDLARRSALQTLILDRTR